MAEGLLPALCKSCDNRIEDVHWFKADWQRGGAATAMASWMSDSGEPIPVVIKFPVVRRELRWTRRMQPNPNDPGEPVVPRLFSSGEQLGGYDLAWIVIERLPHGPLGMTWHDGHADRMATAVARFHESAARFVIDQGSRTEPWEKLMATARRNVTRNRLEEASRWSKQLKVLARRLRVVVSEWEARQPLAWLHGDLHLANAMSRDARDAGDVVLIDFAEVHVGHWVEDAVCFERSLWTNPGRLRSSAPVRSIAAARRSLRLDVDKSDDRLAVIRRMLLAATAPAYPWSEGNPRHLRACLDQLEHALASLR